LLQRGRHSSCHDFVIRRHVLAALSVGVEAGDDAVAREALAGTDWVLRRAAQRRLERALIDAMIQTGEGYTAEDAESLRHVQRVAALDVAGKLDVDIRDRRAVADTFARLPTEPPPRAPVATVLAITGAVAALAVLVWCAIAVRTPARVARRAVPLPAGAFIYGGRPAIDPAIDALLADELTALVIETDAARRGSHDGEGRVRRAQALRRASAISAYGPALTAAWRELLDSLDRWVDAPEHGPRYRTATRELGRRAQDVSEQFAAVGLGYYLSADVVEHGGSSRAVLFSYHVEDVAFVRAGGVAQRVLSLRRLDHLNLAFAMLGRQNEERGDPMVMLDEVDDFATERILPVLDGETYRLGDADWRRGSPAGRQLASDAADAIDRELRAALASVGPDRDARVATIKRLIAATVRRHEARHAIDIDRERPLRYPAQLRALVGARSGATLRTELELAAYVSQIANDPVTPHWALWNLASHAFGQRWGGAEAVSAVVVLEGLARHLGIAPSRPIMIAGHLDREALARLARPLALQRDDTLRAAARALWTELYGEPLLPIVDVLAAR
jgi:hypothetical protein